MTGPSCKLKNKNGGSLSLSMPPRYLSAPMARFVKQLNHVSFGQHGCLYGEPKAQC